MLYSLPLVLVVSLLSVFDVLERPHLFFLDQAFRWREAQEPATEIAIVAVSEHDSERGAPRSPWPRSLSARLLDKVSPQRPAAIVVDILFSERSNTETVITRERFDQIQPYLYQVLTGVPLEIQTREATKVVGPGTHPTLPARDLLRGGSDLSGDLEGKIVFIGVTDPSVEDLFPTPFSGSNRMAGVEYHAAAADTLLRGSFIHTTPGYQVVPIVIVLGLAAVALGRFVRPLFGVGGALAILAALLGAWISSFAGAVILYPLRLR